jgi:hypothetical protein
MFRFNAENLQIFSYGEIAYVQYRAVAAAVVAE